MSHLTQIQSRNLTRILQAYPLPTDGLLVYIETSGFTPGSAVVIDHAVCNLVNGTIPDGGMVSCGVLNWDGLLPDALSMRLVSDLDRIQAGQVTSRRDTRPAFPYTGAVLSNSDKEGYATMSAAVAAIAAAMLQGRTIIGHGLLSFGWPFLKPFLPVGTNEGAYADMVLDRVYDTANIEKAMSEGDEWMPAVGQPFASWQRMVGGYYSKCKWSLRTALFEKYGLQVTPGRLYLAEDMLMSYVDILNQWRQIASGS